MKFTKCALNVYTFVRLEPRSPAAVDAREYLDAVWHACDTLGMSEPFLSSAGVHLSSTPTQSDAFEIVATRERKRGPDDHTVFQAFAFVRHDVFGVVAALAPNDDRTTWGELHTQWTDAMGGVGRPDSILGQTLVFAAHVDGAFDETVPQLIADATSSVEVDIWAGEYVTRDGFHLWEGRDQRANRVVVVLADAGDAVEEALTHWLWWRTKQELAPFGRYLVNASKLHYEKDAYRKRRDEFLKATSDLDDQIELVRSVNSELGGEKSEPGRKKSKLVDDEDVSIKDLLDAQQQVLDAQVEEAGLIHSSARLRELRNTVRVATRNMAMTVPPVPDDSATPDDHFFVRDQRLSEWLDHQIETDLEYAQATLERARGAQNLTALRLENTSDRHRRYQERILLVQTITSGILVGWLATVTWLHLEGPHRTDLALPIALAGATFLLAFPLAVAHWPHHYGRLDQVAVCVFCGLAFWLLAAVAWAAPGWWTALGAIVGVAVGWRLCAWHNHWVESTKAKQ